MTWKINNALKGIGGEFEVNRLLTALGGVVYIIGAPAFQAWTIHTGHVFDITAFCLAYPAGIAAITGGGALAIAHKDKNVASAKVTELTGAVPTPALDGARVPAGPPPPVDKPTEAEPLPEYAA